jgi:hypothetical protein
VLTFKEYISESVLLSGVGDKNLENGYKEIKSFYRDIAGSIIMESIQRYSGLPVTIGTTAKNGKFFIQIKWNPHTLYTKNDIDKLYGTNPRLAHKLYAALQYLPKLGIKDRVLNGNIMFGPGETKKRTLDGQRYISFTPNTTMYMIPLDSDLGKRVDKAKIGIIFYANVNSLNNLKHVDSVWYDTPSALNVHRIELSNDNLGRENEEMTAVVKSKPIFPPISFMGGETGLAGKNVKGEPYLGKPTNQYTDSTGTL